MGKNVFIVNKKIIQGDMKYKGKVLLTYRIEYPELSRNSCGDSFIIFNYCQREKALAYLNYCRRMLFHVAVQEFRYSISNGFPIRPFETIVIYNITYNKNCIISLYYEIYEYAGGAHGSTHRCADTCDLRNGSSIVLNKLVTCLPDYKSYLIGKIKEEIEKDPSIYFEDYATLIVTNFDEDSFYLTTEGIVLFYQQYDIAPYVSGIREFLIPYCFCVKLV